jgi:hypothetical protein
VLFQVEIASGGCGVGGDEVINCPIRHMGTNKVSGVVDVVEVPHGSKCLDLEVGRSLKVGCVDLEIAPDDIPFTIPRDRAQCGQMSEARDGRSTVDGGGRLAGGSPSKRKPVELAKEADLRGIGWGELGNRCIGALQMSATGKSGEAPEAMASGVPEARQLPSE